MIKKYKSPYLLLVVATCLWGGNFVIGRELVAYIPPFTLAFARWVIALLILLPFYGKHLWQQRSILLRHWRSVLLIALTGVTGFNTLLYIAVQYTSPINASLMNAATPIFIVLLSLGVLEERLTARRIIGIALSLSGVVWIISRGSWAALLGLSFNRGDLWMLLAVAIWAVYSIGVKKMAGMMNQNVLLTANVIITVPLLLPFAAAEWMGGRLPQTLTVGLVSGVLYIGIFASIVAFMCWNTAVTKLGPGRCAIYLNLIPLFSALFATLFTSEPIHLYHGIGALLVIGGVVTATKKGKQALPRGTFKQ